MTSIEAIYQGGVFRPVGAIELPEGQRVRLRVEPLAQRGRGRVVGGNAATQAKAPR